MSQHTGTHFIILAKMFYKSPGLGQHDDELVTAVFQCLFRRDGICDTAVIIFLSVQFNGREKHRQCTGGTEHGEVFVHVHGVFVLSLSCGGVGNPHQAGSLKLAESIHIKGNQFVWDLSEYKIQSEETPALFKVLPAHIPFIISIFLHDLQVSLGLPGYIGNSVCNAG